MDRAKLAAQLNYLCLTASSPSSFQNRCCFLKRPAISDAPVKQLLANAVLLRDSAPRGAVISPPNNGSVPSLRFRVSPNAVFWAVPLVAIDPLNAQALFVPVTYGPKVEAFKGLPFLANRYSSRAVEAVLNVFWICASLLHGLPNVMQWRPRLPMRFCGLNNTFGSHAAAGFCFPGPEVSARWGAGAPAFANAIPDNAAALHVSSLVKNSPAAKPLPSKVNKFRMWFHH